MDQCDDAIALNGKTLTLARASENARPAWFLADIAVWKSC